MSTPAPDGATWLPPRRQLWVTLVIAVLAAAALLAVGRAWGWLGRAGAETTENAYVRGRTTVIAPQVSGYVAEVRGHDYGRVAAGSVLLRIDDAIYRARVELARANLDAARHNRDNNVQARATSAAALRSADAALVNAAAQQKRAEADVARQADLAEDGAVSMRERDQGVATLAVAVAQRRQAEAARDQAREAILTVDTTRRSLSAAIAAAQAQLDAALIDLGHTVITAPETGQLGEITVRLGQYVTNGTQLMALVPDERWIIANYKEAQTAAMAIGQRVQFTVDALGGASMHGRVEQIAPATASEFAVIRPENGTGNFVKVPQRIGLRIRVDPDQAMATRLRPGMSVVTHIDTRSQ